MIAEAPQRGRWAGLVFQCFLVFSLAVGVITLIVLFGQVLIDSQGYLDTSLLENPPSALPELAGARPAILASIYLAVLVFGFSVPIGVLTAIYLEEYAQKERWYNRLLELNIQNLAGVPSIVYGILGLAFLVSGYRARPDAPCRIADPDPAGPPDGDHRLPGSAALGPALDPRRARTRWARPSGR